MVYGAMLRKVCCKSQGQPRAGSRSLAIMVSKRLTALTGGTEEGGSAMTPASIAERSGAGKDTLRKGLVKVIVLQSQTGCTSLPSILSFWNAL